MKLLTAKSAFVPCRGAQNPEKNAILPHRGSFNYVASWMVRTCRLLVFVVSLYCFLMQAPHRYTALGLDVDFLIDSFRTLDFVCVT